MQFIRTNSPDPAATHIARIISDRLKQNEEVLWLISGGSSIDVAVRARQILGDSHLLSHLLVMQVDERYGPVGHKDSNWQQLRDAGFITTSIKNTPILEGEDFTETVRDYGRALNEVFETSAFSIGLFGIGADGHTAGILPDSPAATADTLSVGYQGSDFQRITMTPAAIARLDVAVVYAAGSNKHRALKQLKGAATVSQQPAQALKAAREVYVYNDYMEDSV